MTSDDDKLHGTINDGRHRHISLERTTVCTGTIAMITVTAYSNLDGQNNYEYGILLQGSDGSEKK